MVTQEFSQDGRTFTRIFSGPNPESVMEAANSFIANTDPYRSPAVKRMSHEGEFYVVEVKYCGLE